MRQEDIRSPAASPLECISYRDNRDISNAIRFERLKIISKKGLPPLLGFSCNAISDAIQTCYRSGMLNSNMVNLKFHLIRSFFEIFARFLSFHV